MNALSHAVQSIYKDLIQIRRNENVLILADEYYCELACYFYQALKTFSDNRLCVITPEIKYPNQEPPERVAALMIKADVILMLTRRSLSDTHARNFATQKGTRIASLPGITKEILCRNMNGNYEQLVNLTTKIADILTIGRSAHLYTSVGTDLTCSLVRMKGYADTGILRTAGSFSNLPAGESSISPVQGTTQGTLVIDGSFPEIGCIETPIKMTIHQGRVTRISGGKEAEKVRCMLKRYGRAGREIAELGIGTNPSAKLTGCTLEDEKVLGTVHISLGNNISFGGRNAVQCHYDGILRNPTLIIDTKKIIESGILQV